MAKQISEFVEGLLDGEDAVLGSGRIIHPLGLAKDVPFGRVAVKVQERRWVGEEGSRRLVIGKISNIPVLTFD